MDDETLAYNEATEYLVSGTVFDDKKEFDEQLNLVRSLMKSLIRGELLVKDIDYTIERILDCIGILSRLLDFSLSLNPNIFGKNGEVDSQPNPVQNDFFILLELLIYLFIVTNCTWNTLPKKEDMSDEMRMKRYIAERVDNLYKALKSRQRILNPSAREMMAVFDSNDKMLLEAMACGVFINTFGTDVISMEREIEDEELEYLLDLRSHLSVMARHEFLQSIFNEEPKPREIYDDDTSVDTSSSNSCFIATAAYSTSIHLDLDTFRSFRDEKLLPHPLGAKLVNLYYKISPSLAHYIAQQPTIKKLLKHHLSHLANWMRRSTN